EAGGAVRLWEHGGLLLAIAIGGAAAAAAACAYRLMRSLSPSAHGSVRGSAEEVAELRRNLLTAEAVIKAEPQVLVFWDQGQGVRVMVHTLATIPGLPQ